MSDCKLSGTAYDKDDWPLPRKPEDERVKEIRRWSRLASDMEDVATRNGISPGESQNEKRLREYVDYLLSLFPVQPAPSIPSWLARELRHACDRRCSSCCRNDPFNGEKHVWHKTGDRYDGQLLDCNALDLRKLVEQVNAAVQPAASTPTKLNLCPSNLHTWEWRQITERYSVATCSNCGEVKDAYGTEAQDERKGDG